MNDILGVRPHVANDADFVAEIGIPTRRGRAGAFFEAIHCHPLDGAGAYARFY
jgi:hypothetical protein